MVASLEAADGEDFSAPGPDYFDVPEVPTSWHAAASDFFIKPIISESGVDRVVDYGSFSTQLRKF